jgi:O-antigen ligase
MQKYSDLAKKISHDLISFLILGIVFFVPLYFAFFLKTYGVYSLDKFVLFSSLFFLLLFFLLIKHLLNNMGIFPKIDKSRFVRYSAVPALFLLSLTLGIRGSFYSFWGSYDRQMGFLVFLILVIFYFILFNYFRTEANRNKVIMAAVFSAFIAGLYGIFQKAGIDYFSWKEAASATGRVFSTLGQPNFFASFLVLTIPLNLWLIGNYKKKIVRLIFSITLAVQLLSIYWTFSRGGWIGLLASGLVGVFYVLNLKIKKTKKQFIIFLALSVIVAGGVIFQFSKDRYFSNRIRTIFNAEQGSTALRLDFWKSGLKAFAKKPFFGYGLESQGNIYPDYYTKGYVLKGGVINGNPDRAHNLVLDTLLTGSLLGLLFYGLLIFFFFRLAFQNLKTNPKDFLSLALIAGMAGYLATLMFSFPVLATELYFWVYLALVASINAGNSSHPVEQRDPEKNSNRLIFSLKIIIISVVGAFCIYGLRKNIDRIKADHYFYKLAGAQAYGQPYIALTLYEYITELKVPDLYYKTMYGNMLADWRKNDNSRVAEFLTAKSISDIFDSMDEADFQQLSTKARLAALLANEKEPEYYQEAERMFKQAIKRSPEMSKNYRELGFLYFKQKRYNEAEEQALKSISQIPEIDRKKYDARQKKPLDMEFYNNYDLLSKIKSAKGNKIEAEKYQKLAEESKKNF